MSRSVSLSVLRSRERALSRPIEVSPPRSWRDPSAQPVPPHVANRNAGLAAKHDFVGKLRHPALIERLKEYVRAQVAMRNGDLPEDGWLPDAAPVSINLDLTTACNYACDHCVDKEILNQPIKYNFERLCDSLTKIAERGLRSVIVIGGGEPTVHPKFADAMRHMKSLGLQVAVVSNGSGQKKIEEIADCLDEYDWVRLSLDSAHDDTFTAMHKPNRPITLDQICEPVRRIKSINPTFQFGYSFIITWKGATINDSLIVENLHEMVAAADRAKRFGFDYISFKPFLTRAPENNAEIVDLRDADARFEEVMGVIRRNVDEAKTLQTDSFAVLESTNLRVLESRSHHELMNQPHQCHMQFFRQVLSPLGLYNCPVYRNQPHGWINGNEGYADDDGIAQTLFNTSRLIRSFDATSECDQVTCLYNGVNWWIEQLIRNPERLDDLQADESRGPDFFF